MFQRNNIRIYFKPGGLDSFKITALTIPCHSQPSLPKQDHIGLQSENWVSITLVPLFLTTAFFLCRFLFQMLNGLNGFAFDDILLLGTRYDTSVCVPSSHLGHLLLAELFLTFSEAENIFALVAVIERSLEARE
jgi:hypothetical protein